MLSDHHGGSSHVTAKPAGLALMALHVLSCSRSLLEKTSTATANVAYHGSSAVSYCETVLGVARMLLLDGRLE